MIFPMISRALPVLVALGALAGCAAESEEEAPCKFGDLVGTCCTPLDPSGAPLTRQTADGPEELLGVCNAQDFCQFGSGPANQAPADACGTPAVAREDMGRTIRLDVGVEPPVGGGAGGSPSGGDTPPLGGEGPPGGNAGGAPVGGTPVGGGAGGEPGGPCDGVSCDPGERCNPANGRCESVAMGEHAGPCVDDADCPPGDDCLGEEESMGRVPGGFCRADCASDRDCGAGKACLASGQTNLCFDTCGAGIDCRDGWNCIDIPDGGVSVCQPDCRVAACDAGQVCNDATGQCEIGCPYACSDAEECRNGHCVRLGGTCDTSYHCEVGTEECRDGRCVTAQFSDCTQDPNLCDAQTQTCINAGEASICLVACQNDDICPQHMGCIDQAFVCYYTLCGPSEGNGEVYGRCAVGSQLQWEGTCLPLAVGDPAQPGADGLCLEAGSVMEGQPCNDQAIGRTAGDRAQQCASGMLCYGDPDDPLDPSLDFDQTGACAGLCDPGSGLGCSAGRQCIDFSTQDDPTTPNFDETRPIGLCLASDCRMGQDAMCGAGRQCRPFNLITDRGSCGPAGVSGIGERCTTAADCSDEAFCGDPGGGAVCLATCSADADCADGRMCVQNADAGWAYGICL